MKLPVKSAFTKCSAGFGLVEMLMTVSILGIMIALTLPSIHFTSEAKVESARRNAQTIVSTATMASLAGADFVVRGNLVGTVDRLMDGVSPTSGVFAGRQFKLNGLSEDAATEATKYLKLVGDEVHYTGKKSGTGTGTGN